MPDPSFHPRCPDPEPIRGSLLERDDRRFSGAAPQLQRRRGRDLYGHANTNAELVAAARAQIAELGAAASKG